MIIVDGFSPYHSGYFRELCTSMSVNVIDLYSDYVSAILLQKASKRSEEDEVNSMRIPRSSEVPAFLSRLPSEPTALYCESDAGLRQSESLASDLSLSVERHNDLSDYRRDKGAMHEELSRAGYEHLPETVVCGTAEEARAFRAKNRR